MPYRFKEARIQSGKSVAEVAKLLQVAETSVRNWDNGYKKPSLDLLIRLADLYGVTTDYLLGRAMPSVFPKLVTLIFSIIMRVKMKVITVKWKLD